MYGITKNPHDLTRTPGGSSGGESALIGAGASLVGIGSDIGGSCRNPASCTGVFGMKYCSQRVSNGGHAKPFNVIPGSEINTIEIIIIEITGKFHSS